MAQPTVCMDKDGSDARCALQIELSYGCSGELFPATVGDITVGLRKPGEGCLNVVVLRATTQPYRRPPGLPLEVKHLL